MPSISVLITCYNEGKLLKRAIGSLQRQTDLNFEVILVNDCSPDAETNEYCREIEATGIRTIWQQENRGLSSARNTAFAAASGDICCPLDADDTLPESAIEVVRGTFCQNPAADFAFGDYHCFWETGERQTTSCQSLTDGGGLLSPKTLAEGPWILLGTSPCKRELWKRLGGYSQNLSFGGQDVDFWMRALAAGAKGAYVSSPIYCWYRSSNGMNARRMKNFRSSFRIELANILFFDQFGDGLKKRRELLRFFIGEGLSLEAKSVASQLADLGEKTRLVRMVRSYPSLSVVLLRWKRRLRTFLIRRILQGDRNDS